MRNQAGEPMRRVFQKPFYVLPIDTQPPAPKNWALYIPHNSTKEGFELHFDEPLSISALQNGISILDNQGNRVVGKVSINHLQHSWHFVPANPWRKEIYQVKISNAVSDLAGNTIPEAQTIELTFTPE